MPTHPGGRAYKETTLQQLRSFCETARLGSFSAAATALGLSHPTVWKQVHALEREFGAQLVKPFGRGCQLTEAGRVLAGLAGPFVAGIMSLKQRFRDTVQQTPGHLTVATTPRILAEDLPACVHDFEAHWPHVQTTFKEQIDVSVPHAVEAGEAELGIVMENSSVTSNPSLVFEPAYELDVVLITPRNHPLARRRHVRPRDLCDYPVVNGPDAFKGTAIQRALEQLGVFHCRPRRIEAYFASTIRRYVELGFGIGLLPHSPRQVPSSSALHERSMSQYFGRQPVYLVWGNGPVRSQAACAFARTVKKTLAAAR